ncbi:MAG: hypothetical protein NW703_00180 [Nitrospiraceae bacterium]
MSAPDPPSPKPTAAQRLMDYGLMAAILVWAGAVGLMAVNLPDSPWRWVFASLSIAGVATVYGIVRIRRYINSLSKPSAQEKQP